jgi:hypothetical protein
MEMINMGIKPTVIHISCSTGHICGAKYEDWSEKYMGDKYARVLPRCPECQLIVGLFPDKVEPQYVVKQEVAPLPNLFGDATPIIDDDKHNSLEWWAQ